MLSQNNTSEVKENQIKEAIEKEAETQHIHILDDSASPTKDVERSEHQTVVTVDVIKKKPEAKDEPKYEEEEKTESITEIEEIFQVSEDGVTWKTLKKITTITPSGTTERIIELGGIGKSSALDVP